MLLMLLLIALIYINAVPVMYENFGGDCLNEFDFFTGVLALLWPLSLTMYFMYKILLLVTTPGRWCARIIRND